METSGKIKETDVNEPQIEILTDKSKNILVISDSSPSYLWKISRDYSMPSKAEQN